MIDRAGPVLRAGLTLVFLYFGIEKLLGQPSIVALYAETGLGQWPRYVAGAIETVSALILWTAAAPVGALALMVVTVTGFAARVLFVGPPLVHLLALFILATTLLVIDLRRS
ncbi:hypothetical protein SAMN04488020_102243 [Palleronia marisminoris]|uniref:DoxX n=1 Tax=Palleronia marisminoris TaxID=315423 RepID=A0A1Y5RVV7_9RHOB|nr:hypothetical protein [Palleronia marisminoris]SFG44067.1 hypothetical protein SAMN04488020_102243 [Palleronia marisminoris]SLN26719.1 hypothetical protein PAM7066_01038 [Palleronia marisminoris]